MAEKEQQLRARMLAISIAKLAVLEAGGDVVSLNRELDFLLLQKQALESVIDEEVHGGRVRKMVVANARTKLRGGFVLNLYALLDVLLYQSEPQFITSLELLIGGDDALVHMLWRQCWLCDEEKYLLVM